MVHERLNPLLIPEQCIQHFDQPLPRWVSTMNQFGKQREPFFFIIDFDMHLPIVLPLHSKIDEQSLLFNFRGVGNGAVSSRQNLPTSEGNGTLNPSFISSNNYSQAFAHIRREQQLGNSFLANLTFPTEIHPQITSLRELFHRSSAKYRLWLKPGQLLRAGQQESLPENLPENLPESLPSELLVFSPESFIQIHNDRIYTFPMKGTAFLARGDNLDRARLELLEDEKELAEHLTVVDLLRNDLGRVGSDVRVDQFRRIDIIQLTTGRLLQVSSNISARLPSQWEEHIGSIFAALLPAGSVSGAPKQETCRIIHEAETMGGIPFSQNRGYYCGVAGIYNGWTLDSCVLIRFMEAQRTADASSRYFFRSGGGITIYSREEDEYAELRAKVGLPPAEEKYASE